MSNKKIKIFIGMATCGRAAGALAVLDAVKNEIERQKVNAEIIETGCIGMCSKEVLLDVVLPGESRVTYGQVTPKDVVTIFDEHVKNGKVVKKLVVAQSEIKGSKLYEGLETYENLPFLVKQKKQILNRCGYINPETIDGYLETGGYQALTKALKMSPDAIISEVEASGLRGRGGGGFLTGLKWGLCRDAAGDMKYMICNADEGDPGAFMDRSLLESDPHSVLEGMIIGSFAIGAKEAYIYVRSEYPLAVERLEKAIQQAQKKGYLGKNILGSGFDCQIKIKKGSGAFVCGEETALMASIEGKRGMPRPRPPFPAQKGLWGKPTNINNVETFANVPLIILEGGKKFAETGTEKSKGTKIFALTGKVVNTGLIEVPMGITLKEIVFEIGGGIAGGKKFKAVQMGGPSGGCLDSTLLDTPVDYDSLIEAGAIIGSGGCVVMDEDTCMVDIARYFMDFIQSESCGKCVPCRIGTRRMLEILTRICSGDGTEKDLVLLEELAVHVKAAALCGLGKTAPNPVLSTLKYFRDEYLAHIKEKRCPAKVCKNLIRYKVVAEKCKMCGLCLKACPSNAIEGATKGVAAFIQDNKCIRCGACLGKCPTKAIIVADANSIPVATEVK
ncbi:MAG: NADH-quinone oxidoreductase subunit NuoF [Candidatus Omnitrophota bacterium]